MTPARATQGAAADSGVGELRVKRRGPGEAAVVDAGGREVATIHKDPIRRRWRVSMAPARVRTPHGSDPEFDSRRAALAWLSEVQFG